MVSSKIWFCTDSIRLMLLLHSIPPFMLHTLFLLRLSRYILLRIPFLCLILCLHLLSLSPLPHISCSIRLPSSVLTPCIVSLFTERVNSGMNECAGHCQGDFLCILSSLLLPSVLRSLRPHRPVPRPCPLIMCW